MEQTQQEFPKKGRLAGIDYGTVRIGVAVCDSDRIIASPFDIYVRKSEKKDAEYFRKFVQEERIVQFVLGLPLHLDGRLSPKAQEAQAFGAWLTEQTGLPVDYMDERFTSVEASGLLREVKMTLKKRKARIDKIAAQILLTNYIERGCQGTTVWQSLD
ncbi:MAG: Holliday junction resolvase RuvX [Planctomycetia bacterium]|nr:Holliday junction resolvase RuvX [Planctomycetia bacterium]